MSNYLTLEKRSGVMLIWLDQQGEKVNKVSPEMLDAFAPVLDRIAQDAEVKAAVFISKKKDFIAGADIEGFLKMAPGDAAQVGKRGHALLDRVARSEKPFVAAIHGAAMGAGLEIALACTARLLSDDRSTVLALPEVKLGLLPGGGGTQRLPRLIGIQKALDMMLTGKNIYADKARTIGLADQLCPSELLEEEAIALALRLAQAPLRRKSPLSFTEKLLEAFPFTRSILYKKAHQMVERQTQGNYPAPPKIIACVKEGMEKGAEAGFRKEIEEFDHLVQTPEARQLIHLFFALTAKKKNPLHEKAREVKHLGVIGSGLMGTGIAEVSLLKGMQVSIKDLSQANLDDAAEAISESLNQKVSKRALRPEEATAFLENLQTGLEDSLFKHTELIVEAVFEDLGLKQKILAGVEEVAPMETIFASNTSALPISKIAEKAQRPGQVIGMHYFSPVQKMPLLEIVVTDQTHEWVTATAIEVGARQGKACIVVKDGPGFYTTRILAPFLNEALMLLEEGVGVLELDRAMKKFGFPVGPVTLMDEVGIDVGAHVTGGDLMDFFRARGATASTLLVRLADAGFKGKKNGKGFYHYDPQTGKKLRGKVNEAIYPYFEQTESKPLAIEVLQQRMALMMVNEAAHCLQEAVIASPEDGDLGAILGLGFPPFLGGPFRYIDSLGIHKLLSQFEVLQNDFGLRFKPAPILEEYGRSGKQFYA